MNNAPPRSAPPPNMEPIDFECEVGPLPLKGALPAGLRGTLLRNGPNPMAPDPKAHWFSGDGMLHAFRIEDGQVHYRNRWVRTQRWQAAAQGKGQPGSGQESKADPAHDDGTANTNVISHAGHMLALEEAHLPIAVELPSLNTLGPLDFNGELSGSFTAHPKTDPKTGELLFFGYGTPTPLSNGMSFGVISPAGRVTRFERFEAPYASMVHDFMVTDRHVLFPIMPLTASIDRAQSGRPPYAWEPDYGTRVGLMPRAGTARDITWWSGPTCYVFHVMNAWEEAGSVFADVIQFSSAPLFPKPDGSAVSDTPPPSRLMRWHFDLSSKSRDFTQMPLEDIPGEFPRIDQRVAGLPYRHGWYVCRGAPQPGEPPRLYAGLVHVDHATKHRDIYLFPSPDAVSEGVFVPRSSDAEEGDGWLLATVWRGATNSSDLVVFDARALAAGPVCVASLPHRVPVGFHGNWIDSTELEFTR